MNGTSSDREWAREGRRIIPLLRRGTPITRFTSTANRAKTEVESTNKKLLPPAKTHTPKRPRKMGPQAPGLHSPPPKLEDILIKAKDEEGNSRLCVMPPSISVPAPPPAYKAYQEYYGGDVVVLPSGMAIRVMNDDQDENRPRGSYRKRKMTDQLDLSGTKTSYEVLNRQQFFRMPHPPPLASMPPSFGKGPPFMAMGPQLMASATKNRRSSAGKIKKTLKTDKFPGGKKLIPPLTAATSVENDAEAKQPHIIRQPSNRKAENGVKNGSLKTVSPRLATPIKLKEVSAAAASATATLTTGMKVIPACGARILPKPGVGGGGLGATFASATGAPPGTPIYMVATGAPGQNLVRVAKTSQGGIPVSGTPTGPQRVVTLNAAALKSPNVVTFSTGPVQSTLRGAHSQQIVRALQPRSLPATPITNRGITPSKPSVIVVQRGATQKTAAIMGKVILMRLKKMKIETVKKISVFVQNFLKFSKPIVVKLS